MQTVRFPLFPIAINERVDDLNAKVSYLKANAGRLGIPKAEIEEAAKLVNEVNRTQEAMNDSKRRSAFDREARDNAMIAAIAYLRNMIAHYISGNPNATTDDFDALRVYRQGPRRLLPPPEQEPGIGQIAFKDFAAVIQFFDIETGRRAKPAGVMAIEAIYQLGGDPPENVDSMTARKTGTASPIIVQFSSDDEFKMLYIAFRWIGTKGDYGPCTRIYKVVVARVNYRRKK
jgi:hypothetical protein